MVVLKILTTAMIGAVLIVLGAISPKFKGKNTTTYVFWYMALTYILSIFCIWWD